jgi:hypothetical protein
MRVSFSRTPVLTLTVALLMVAPAPALAYVGPGPGLEFVPYFFSLLAWAGVAVGAVLFWPVSALLRRRRGAPPSTSVATEGEAGVENGSQDAASPSLP